MPSAAASSQGLPASVADSQEELSLLFQESLGEADKALSPCSASPSHPAAEDRDTQ